MYANKFSQLKFGGTSVIPPPKFQDKDTSWSFLQQKPTNVTSPNISLHNIHQTSSILSFTQAPGAERRDGSHASHEKYSHLGEGLGTKNAANAWVDWQGNQEAFPRGGWRWYVFFFVVLVSFFFVVFFAWAWNENSWLRLRGWFCDQKALINLREIRHSQEFKRALTKSKGNDIQVFKPKWQLV